MRKSELKSFFLIVDFDGINLGIRDNWSETWLEFNNESDAFEIRKHWLSWILGEAPEGQEPSSKE